MSNRVAFYLALKEIWRNRGRFFLVSLVIALITLLVIFLAGLGEGLGAGNIEYLSKLQGELIIYQEQSNLSASASQLGRSLMNDVRRAPGVADAGPIGFSPVYIAYPGAEETLSVSMLGVEPGRPGAPPVVDGRSFSSIRANETVIGRNVALRAGLEVGDTLVIQSTQGAVEESYPLEVVGVSDGRQFFLQPSLFVPLFTWDRIRPKPEVNGQGGRLAINVVNVKLADSVPQEEMIASLEELLGDVEVVDRKMAYEASPGYTEQQSTINTQRGFTLLIGILVVGGFFQIQTLQKVGQVGVLKALGASNWVVGVAATIQIVTTNFIGVAIGSAATLLLTLFLPPTIPIVFEGQQVVLAVITLLLIGPLGGLVSIRYLLGVEPLTALGLSG